MDLWIKDDECKDGKFLSELEQIPISLQVDLFFAARDRDCNGKGNDGCMSPLFLTCKDFIYKGEQPPPTVPTLPPTMPILPPLPALPALPALPIQQNLQEKQKPKQDFLKLTIGSIGFIESKPPKKRYIFGRNGIYVESESKLTEKVQDFVEPKAKKLKLLSKLLDSGLYTKSVRTIQQPKNINKSKWTLEEDEQLKQIMASSSSNTPFSFSRVCSSMPTRTAKQCRERWHNQLSPDVRKDKWTKEEDETIVKCWKEFGPLWSRMALLLKGRTDNAIKNHFNCTLKKESVPSSWSCTKIKSKE